MIGIGTPWRPLAPLGTNAVIYENADTPALWAPPGLDEWLLRPSKDHYRYNLYYALETKGYCVSGSANLFPQHCIAPAFTPVAQVQELSTELQDTLATMGRKQHTLATLLTPAQHLGAYVSGTPLLPSVHQEPSAESQRVINIVNTATSPRIQRVSDAPATRLANNSTYDTSCKPHPVPTSAQQEPTPLVSYPISRKALIYPSYLPS